MSGAVCVWERMAEMAKPDESVSTIVGRSGSKCRSKGGEVNRVLRALKAIMASDGKVKGRAVASLLVSRVKGSVRWA